MSIWKDKWCEDIDYLKDNLMEKHKNLFHYTKKEVFLEKIDKLKDMVDSLDYDEMKVEISRLTATIKDAHTSVIFPVKKVLPFKFYWFRKGIYIVKATEKYKEALFTKVLKVEDEEIETVIRDLSEIISYENESLLKAQSVKYMEVADVLYGLLIIDSMEKVKLTIEAKGEKRELEVETCAIGEIEYVETYLPLHLRRSSENLWYEHLKEKEVLYIKYNSCRERCYIEGRIKEIIDIIEKKSIKKVTIDMRNNMGGDSRLLKPLIDYLVENKEINKKENLKIIIGRETFSSALLNAYEFKWKTNGEILGEPSGGKPNCYGEIESFILPNSKFKVTYSTRYYKLIDDDSIMSLYPDNYNEV